MRYQPQPPLTALLHGLDECKGNMQDQVMGLISTIEGYRFNTNYDLVLFDLEKLPKVDFTDFRRDLILSRIQPPFVNPILQSAIGGHQSVEHTLEELSEINKGYKRFFKKPKKEGQNQLVWHMQNLIGCRGIEPNNILVNSLSVHDHPVDSLNLSVYGTLAGTALGIGLFATGLAVPAAIVYTTAVGLATGAGFSLATIRSNNALPWEEARYLDNQIDKYIMDKGE